GVSIPSSAQVGWPGGYPGGGYPGGYPGGGYPYPGGGSPYPGGRRGGMGVPFPQPRQTQQDKEPELQHYKGKLKKLEDKSLTLELDDTTTLDLKRNGKTKFYKALKEVKASDLRIGDPIAVDATQDKKGTLTAQKVTYEEAPPE